MAETQNCPFFGHTGLRRPGKSDGISATWNYYPRKLFVFTTCGGLPRSFYRYQRCTST